MLEIDCIKDAVAPRHWNEARRDFFARFLIALLIAQTVCLTRIASLFPSSAKIASRYHRMRRFFGGFVFEQDDLARAVIGLAVKAGAKMPFVLAFDRTEWHLGKVVLNVFLIGIVHGRVVFPPPLDFSAASCANRPRAGGISSALDNTGQERV